MQPQQQLEKPEDLLIQYLSQVVIPRLKRADELYMAGMPLQALRALKSLIRSLYHTEGIKDLVRLSWFTRIEEVEAIRGTGSATIYRTYNTEWRRNTIASKTFEELEDEIWAQLHSLEYFKVFDSRWKMVYPSEMTPVGTRP